MIELKNCKLIVANENASKMVMIDNESVIIIFDTVTDMIENSITYKVYTKPEFSYDKNFSTFEEASNYYKELVEKLDKKED